MSDSKMSDALERLCRCHAARAKAIHRLADAMDESDAARAIMEGELSHHVKMSAAAYENGYKVLREAGITIR